MKPHELKRFWRRVLSVKTRRTRNGRGKIHTLTLECGHFTERLHSRTAFSHLRPGKKALRANCETCEQAHDSLKLAEGT